MFTTTGHIFNIILFICLFNINIHHTDSYRNQFHTFNLINFIKNLFHILKNFYRKKSDLTFFNKLFYTLIQPLKKYILFFKKNSFNFILNKNFM